MVFLVECVLDCCFQRFVINRAVKAGGYNAFRVVAAKTTLPVIGIPCKSAQLDGMDALLATVMMPTGIPVATVAVDGAANAAILAVEILALSDDSLAQKLEKMKADMEKGVGAKDAAMQAKVAEL